MKNRWLKRLLYFLLVVAWLLLLALPALAFTLAARGEIVLGNDPQRQTRLFLLQERDVGGIGLVHSRPVAGGQSATRQCVETGVRYFLWEGEGESTRSCQCYERGELVSTNQNACLDD